MSGSSQVTVRSRVRIPLALPQIVPCNSEIITFHGLRDAKEHIAIKLGNIHLSETPLVRLHSECLTGDVLGSQRCDCGPQLQESVQAINESGGYLLYLRQEGRGIGLYNKLDAYVAQDRGLDTYEANRALDFPDDARSYQDAAQMLTALSVFSIRLLSNNPDKAMQLEQFGIQVIERITTGVHANPWNQEYLRAKAKVGLHTIDLNKVDQFN